MKSTIILAAVAATFAITSASAQQAQSGGQSAFNLPEGCRSAAQASGHGDMMQKMQSGMSQQMQGMQGMIDQMTETQKGLHQAMMAMNGPMMMGMMAKDPDVAWICAMIPHHQGAIAMARAGLQDADNAESKRLAEETIKDNEKSLKELTAWVEKHAARESKNETGSPRR